MIRSSDQSIAEARVSKGPKPYNVSRDDALSRLAEAERRWNGPLPPDVRAIAIHGSADRAALVRVEASLHALTERHARQVKLLRSQKAAWNDPVRYRGALHDLASINRVRRWHRVEVEVLARRIEAARATVQEAAE